MNLKQILCDAIKWVGFPVCGQPSIPKDIPCIEGFDIQRAHLYPPDLFQRFPIPQQGISLQNSALQNDELLIVFERQGKTGAVVLQQMVYHHAAQGTLGESPFLVSFCGVCHSGIGLIPVVDGKVRHFSAGGLYNGIVLLIDDETRSYWHHTTGEALCGTSIGATLETFPLHTLSVREARKQYPGLQVYLSKPTWRSHLFSKVSGRPMQSKGFLPPGFRDTMRKTDPRLPELTPGLGIVTPQTARFYPFSALSTHTTDQLDGKALEIMYTPESGAPFARWHSGEVPLQLQTRWYGFVSTHHNCEIYRPQP